MEKSFKTKLVKRIFLNPFILVFLFIFSLIFIIPVACANQSIDESEKYIQRDDLKIENSKIVGLKDPNKSYQKFDTLLIPADIQEISDHAFDFNSLNINSDFSKHIKTIRCDKYAQLKKIGISAFVNFTHLEKIALPNNFQKFGQECFKNCPNLSLITIYSNNFVHYQTNMLQNTKFDFDENKNEGLLLVAKQLKEKYKNDPFWGLYPSNTIYSLEEGV